MSVVTLVAPDGSLNPAALSSVPSESDESLSIISILSVHNLRQHELLDDLFQTLFYSASDMGICAATTLGDDSAAIAELPHHVLLLSSEPYDGPDRLREDAREKATHLSLALSDAVLFIVRMNELTRMKTNGIGALQTSLTQTLLLQADRVVPTPANKRAFLSL